MCYKDVLHITVNEGITEWRKALLVWGIILAKMDVFACVRTCVRASARVSVCGGHFDEGWICYR